MSRTEKLTGHQLIVDYDGDDGRRYRKTYTIGWKRSRINCGKWLILLATARYTDDGLIVPEREAVYTSFLTLTDARAWLRFRASRLRMPSGQELREMSSFLRRWERDPGFKYAPFGGLQEVCYE